MIGEQNIHIATEKELQYVIHLQKKFTNELGFLPYDALREYLLRKQIKIGEENSDPAGYLLFRPISTQQKFVATIVQAAVQMDSRRRHLGLNLVQSLVEEAAANGSRILQCWCAADIEAREFWKSAGFIEVARKDPANTRGRELILYRKALTSLRVGELETIPASSGVRRKVFDVPGQSTLFGEVQTAKISLRNTPII